MQFDCQENLKSIPSLPDKLNAEQYRFPSSYLSGASIGQQFLYLLLSQTYMERGATNYDKRRQAMLLEKEPTEAAKMIRQMIHRLLSEKNGRIGLPACFLCGVHGTKLYHSFLFSAEVGLLFGSQYLLSGLNKNRAF